jgi:hypothetical protein
MDLGTLCHHYVYQSADVHLTRLDLNNNDSVAMTPPQILIRTEALIASSLAPQTHSYNPLRVKQLSRAR